MKILRYLTILLAGIVVLSLHSCEEEEDRLIYDGEALAFFDDDDLTGDFFVQDVADASFDITVGLTKPASSDVTLTITVIDSLTTAVSGTHYEIPGSVTIKKGESTGTLSVTGIYSGFSSEILTLGFKIEDDKVFNEDRAIFNMTLQRYCPFDINDFVGTWTVSDFSDYNGQYDDYQVTTEVYNGDTLLINGLWESTPTVLMAFDDSDPANFTATIFDQFYANHSTYGEMRIVEMSPGSFSACNMTISTSFEIYVSAGFFDKVSSSEWTYDGP